MKPLEWRNVDKSRWGAGPWQDEPDAAQWRDEATGLPCLIHRSESSVSLCGYVGVAKGHPAYGREYDAEGMDFDVHGGLTYSDSCDGEPGTGICHLPELGEPAIVWWLGFDCSHAWDLSPRLHALLPEDRRRELGVGETYKDFAYVKAECARLARQLHKRRK